MKPTPSTVLTYLLLALGLCLFVPWNPLVASDSYEYLMHLTAVHGWQFGTEVVGTYGPLGFLVLPYFHPDTFGRLIVASVAIYVAATLWLRRYWTDAGGHGPAPALWSVLVLVLPAFMSTRVYSPALYAPFVLANAFVLRRFLMGTDAFRVGEAVPVALLAACSLVKPTLFAVSVAAVALVAIDQVVTWRRAPWQPVVLAVAVAASWLAAGQQLTHVAAYLAGAMEMTVGYKDAMALRSLRSDALALLFVAASAVLLGILIRATWTRLRWRVLGPAAMLALTLFVVFQHGFVRADEPHIMPACLTLAALGLAMLPVLPRGRVSWRQPSTAVFGVSLLLLVASWRLGFGAPAVGRILVERPAALWSLLTRGASPLRHAAALRADALARHDPLTGVREPVDPSAIDMDLASVNHLTMTVRPTGVMYAAYTPPLSQRNRHYIESAAGPGTMLLPAGISPDGRYPTVTDSLSLLGLRTHFELTGRTSEYLILQRRARARTLELVRLDERRVAIGDTIPVPDHGADLIWVAIDLQPTLAGALFGLVYQPATVSITVHADAGTETFPLISAMAREGMILAPVQGDHPDFEWLYGSPPPRPAGDVRSFRLGVERGRAWCYRPQATVTFSRMVLSP